MEPAFASETTRVSVRRFIAHMIDGVVIMLLFIVLAVPAAIVSGVLLALVLMGSRYRRRFGDRVGATYVVGD